MQDKDSFKISFYALILVLSFIMLSVDIQSPTPDIIVSIFIIYVFVIFIERPINERTDQWPFRDILLFSLIVVLITFKLSSAALIIISPFLLFYNKLSVKSCFLLGSIGFIILTPYLVRNALLSGWLIYPIPQIDLFDFDWKTPIENVERMNSVIKAWAKYPREIYEKGVTIPFKEWASIWWHQQYSDTFRRGILLTNVISPIILLLYWIFSKKNNSFNKVAIAYIVIVINLMVWFTNAPDWRFASGLLIINTAIVIGLVLKRFENSLTRALSLLIPFAVFIYFFEIPKPHQEAVNALYARKQILIYPQEIEIPQIKSITNPDGLILKMPVNDDRCFNTAIPCTPNQNVVNIKLRGNSIEDGFKIN